MRSQNEGINKTGKEIRAAKQMKNIHIITKDFDKIKSPPDQFDFY